MEKRKHAEAAIHWFNGGQIEWNNKPNAQDEDPHWFLWDGERSPVFYERNSWRIHDPYRELKKRFKEGAVIQCRKIGVGFDWSDASTPQWDKGHEYRECPAPPAKRKIGWSKMPVGTLCEAQGKKFSFTGVVSCDGQPRFFTRGSTSATYFSPSVVTGKIVILPQDWKPWFGGECPVPPGVMVEYHMRSGKRMTFEGIHLYWEPESADSAIIAYRILGVAKGWEE